MKCLEPWLHKPYRRLNTGGSPIRAGDRKLSNLMTIHVDKSVTSHEVSNIYSLRNFLTIPFSFHNPVDIIRQKKSV